MNLLTDQRLTRSIIPVGPHQQDHVPSTADRAIPAYQWQDQSDTNAVIQNCPCSICSRARYADNQTISGTIEYQDRTVPVEQVVPYADQNVGAVYATDITNTVDFSNQEWTFTPQALQYQNAEYAPLHEALDPLQVQMDMAPNEGALDMSAPERLRRLAGRCINDPDSTVNGVHLESGPSGRLQVVITIQISDVLGDAMT